MIKVIEGLKIKDEEGMQLILLKLRTNVMQYPGFITAEFLRNEHDISLILIISTWQKTEFWRGWSESRIMKDLYRQAEISLVDGPRVSMYNIIPTRV